MAIYASTSTAGYGTPSGSSPLPRAAKVVGVSGTTFCVCGWFKMGPIQSAALDAICLIGQDAAGLRGEWTATLVATTGQFSFFFRPGGSPNPSVTLTTTPRYDDNRWHWYAFRRVGDADYRGYLDSPSPFGTSTASITTAPASGNTYIALFNNNGTQANQGNIIGPCWMFKQDIGISAIMDTLHGRQPPVTPNNYYPMTDLNGTDLSGNNYRLTNVTNVLLTGDDPILTINRKPPRALRTRYVTGAGVFS